MIREARFLLNSTIVENSPDAEIDGDSTDFDNDKKIINLNFNEDSNQNELNSFKMAFVETKQRDDDRLARSQLSERVATGLENLLAFQGDPNILKVYGFCKENVGTGERTVFIRVF